MDKRVLKKILLSLGLLLLLLLAYWLYLEFHTEIQLLLNPKASREMLMREVRSHGILTAGGLFFLTTLMCALPGLPTSVIGVLVGLCYGPIIGSCVNIAGNVSGNLLSMTALKYLNFGRYKPSSSKWSQQISQMKHPKTGLMIAYMIPVIPSFVINVTANSLKLSIREVFLPVLIGVLPSSMLYAFGGEALFHGYIKTALTLVASVIILVLLVKFIKRDHHLDE